MFKDSRIDSEQSHEVSFATGTTCSVQPLRIDPINGGAWCLPGIHPDIPVVIDTGDLAADAIIARLALEAHAAGVCIPEGEFTTPEDTLKKQWTNYVNSAVGEHSSLYMHMQVHAATDNITVGFEPPGNIEIFRMKPLVEELNAACRGLGWWVVDVAFSACQDRYQIYTPVVVADYLEMNVPGNSFADSDVVANFNEWEGTDLTQAQIQESNEFFWPSDLIKSVGDHAWMLKRTLYDPKTGRFNPIGKKPYVASLSKARAFAKNSTDPRLKQAVADFILLHEELARKDSLMREVEPSSNFYASEDYDPECIGAAAGLVWDSPELSLEIIEHHEQDLQNSGEYTETHFVFSASPNDPSSICRLVNSIKDFALRHGAISKAYSHFENIEDVHC
jgi:PRTRC genetic system protein F